METALREAGAQHVVRAKPPAPGRLTVYAGDAALAAQKPDGAAALPAEGYALGIVAGRIVLAGKDTTGTCYAAQTLRQALPHRKHPGGRPARPLRRAQDEHPSRAAPTNTSTRASGSTRRTAGPVRRSRTSPAGPMSWRPRPPGRRRALRGPGRRPGRAAGSWSAHSRSRPRTAR
ncbi:glycoside hydrolase family 20 zincin-like fold domain-containing protein [Streptomyces sp. DT224]|uniref:glycoside hydrolase family 20 zincin-like fold domain-containing protein n=1 Tax=Streptomyces sp. DT224 TaxID=3393426 RepID=UPI003CF27164